MSLNSFVTRDGYEMGRAQVQAQGCRLEPDVRMNPILQQDSSHGCGEDALACVRAGALKHQGRGPMLFPKDLPTPNAHFSVSHGASFHL